MMSKSKILDDYLELVTYGFTNPMPDADEGPWKITAKDVAGGEINFNTARKTTQEAYDTKLTKKSRPKVGDVLLTKDGTLGRLAIVQQEDLCINQSVAVLRPNEKILPEYLFYLLSTPVYQRQMIGDSDGTVIKHIYITRVGKMEVDIPSIEVQKERLKHLLALDGKIKINRQTNQTLEHIAQATFKSWFVDFEPTRAKIAAKQRWQALHDVVETSSPTCYSETDSAAKPNTQSLDDAMSQAAMAAISGKTPEELQQLSPEQLQHLQSIAALFPDAMIESDLGEIPEGWGGARVEDMFELHRGFDLPKKDRTDGPYPVFAAGGYHGQHDSFKMEPPGIITGRSGVIGNVYLCLEKYWPLNTTLYVRKFKKCGPFYAYFYLNTCDLKSINSGSAVPSLNRNFVHSLRCFLPDEKLLQEFERKVSAIFHKIKANELEVSKLSSLRDYLLPRLLSGDLLADRQLEVVR
jgi:type I restriction enzyme S subunit